MADPTIRVIVTAEENKWIQSQRKQQAQLKKTGKGYKDLVKDAKEVEKADKRLERQATQTFEKSKTAAQRYTDKIKMLNRAKEKGILDEQQHAQAVRHTAIAMRNTSVAAERAKTAGRSAFGPPFLSSLRGITAALGITGGVAGAVQLVRTEYEALLEVQQRAKDVALPAADAEIRMLRNLGAETAQQRDEVKASIRATAGRLRMPESAVEIAMSSALSARGSSTISKALAAVEPALQIAPESPETAAALAGAALDISKQGPGITPKSAIGFTLAGIQKARVVDTEKFAISAPRAAQAAVLRGGTPREGVALLSALTQSMVDVMGRQATTASLQVVNQLAKPKEFKGKGADPLMPLRAAGGLTEALDLLKNDPELRKAFLESASFQEKAKASIELLVSGGSVRADFEQFKRELPRAAEAEDIFERKLAIQRGTPLQKTAEMSRAVKATVEELERRDPIAARLGIIAEDFGPLMQRTGMSRMGSRLEKLAASADRQGLDAYIEAIERRATGLEAGFAAAGGGYSQFAMAATRQPTELEKDQAAILNRLADVLEELSRQNQPPVMGSPGVLPVNDPGDHLDR